MFNNISPIARLIMLGVGSLVVINIYWEVLASQGVTMTPFELNDLNFRISYLINFVVVLLVCFTACEISLKKRRPIVRQVTSVLLLFLITATTATLFPFPQQLWGEFIAYHAPSIVVPAIGYSLWLSDRNWGPLFQSTPPGKQHEVLVGNLTPNELCDTLGLDRNIATEITELHVRATP